MATKGTRTARSAEPTDADGNVREADGLPVLAPGFWVALALRSGHLPPVGVIQAIDEHGIRLTHIDWVMGTATGWDVFVPWGEILHMDIATHKHYLKGFGEHAGRFQQEYRTDKAEEHADEGSAQPAPDDDLAF